MSVPNPATVDWVPIFAGGNPLAYRGDFAPGTYQDGDIVVQGGIAYLCVGGPTSLAPDIGPWGGAAANRPPGELAYVEKTTPTSITSVTEATPDVVITAPPVTLDGLTPIIIDFFAPYLHPGVGTDQLYLVLFDGANNAGRLAIHTGLTGQPYESVKVGARLTPAAGSHTFSIRAWKVGATAGVEVGGGSWGGVGTYGPAFLRVTQANPVFIAPAGPTVPTYGTSLPASPADGQEHVLVDSLTNPTYQWRFRFNAGSVSAYKWEFVGGAPLRAANNVSDALAAGTAWQGFPTDCALTIPRSGDYLVYTQARFGTANACRVKVAAWDTSGTFPADEWPDNDGTGARTISGIRTVTGMVAGHTYQLICQFQATPTTPTGSQKQLHLTPVRVA